MKQQFRPLLKGVATLAAVLALGGCAAGSAGNGMEGTPDAAAAAADGQTVLTIQNNHQSGRDVTLHLEPEGRGERIHLGTVQPGMTGTFTHGLDRGFYRIIAGTQAGEIRSDRFNISGPSTLNWVMGNNRLTVRRR